MNNFPYLFNTIEKHNRQYNFNYRKNNGCTRNPKSIIFVIPKVHFLFDNLFGILVHKIYKIFQTKITNTGPILYMYIFTCSILKFEIMILMQFIVTSNTIITIVSFYVAPFQFNARCIWLR